MLTSKLKNPLAYNGKVYLLLTLSLSWPSMNLCSSQSLKEQIPRKIHPGMGSIIAEAEERGMATHRLEALLAMVPTFASITLAKVLNRMATHAFSMRQGCTILLWGGAAVQVKTKSLPWGPGREKEPGQGPRHLEAKC